MANESLSARRAWIEIADYNDDRTGNPVALRKESVDRNRYDNRNPADYREVALRKESVDRNSEQSERALLLCASLSARRAWIEIRAYAFGRRTGRVALRKESVDRNLPCF